MPATNGDTSPTPALDVAGATRRYGATTVLDQVDLRVRAGSVCAVLGPSGSGKSTLLRIIAGLEPSDAGRIGISGRDVSALAPHRRGVGLVFQDHALFPHLDVRANVAFGLVEAGWTRPSATARVDELLADLGLRGLAARRVDALSGGERQRVALARALAPRPSVLLLDEPLASLDRSLRERLARDLAVRLRQAGLASVLVTHDLDEAATVADELVVLDAGTVVQSGSVSAVVDAPANAWVARFLGHPNVFEGAERARLPHPAPGALWLRDELITLLPRDGADAGSGVGADVIDAVVERHTRHRGGVRLDLRVPAWDTLLVWRGALRELPDADLDHGQRLRMVVPERAWHTLPSAHRPLAATEIAA